MCAHGFEIAAAPTLSLREKIAQLLCIRIGSNLRPVCTAEQDEERVTRLLDECCLGGLVLFNGGKETQQVLGRLQARARSPLLIGSDIERGVGQQVKGYSLFPHLTAFGKLPQRDAEMAVEEFARTLCAEASQVGIHIAFCPVADVSTNPQNPIIATRAFSENPQRTSELVALFVQRVQSMGLLATAKHFPGHGDTDLDSHSTLPKVKNTREQLEACELLPFRTAIIAGCALIMTAHIGFPALDTTGTPATFSAPILKTLLRDEMGFRGVICTDSLLMAGARDRFESEGAMAHAALLAGVDLLLDLADPIAVVDHLCECVERGTLDPARINESLDRIRKLKVHRPSVVANPASSNAAKSIARQAIRLIRAHRSNVLPLAADKPLAVILLKPFETPIDPPEQPLAAALRQRFHNVTYMQLGPCSGAADYAAARDLARYVPQLLVAMIVRPAAWQVFGLRPEQKTLVSKLLEDRNDMVLVSLGVPTVLNDFPQAAASICSYSDVPVSQEAVVEFLLDGDRRLTS